jgi:hypothetical protein
MGSLDCVLAMDDPKLEWTNEPLKKLPSNNFLYFLFCLFTFRLRKKLTYKEMYLIMAEVNRKLLGEERAKKFAFEKIIDFYEYNNGNRPI